MPALPSGPRPPPPSSLSSRSSASSSSASSRSTPPPPPQLPAPIDYPDRPDATLETVREVNLLQNSGSGFPIPTAAATNKVPLSSFEPAPNAARGRGRKREERRKMDEEEGNPGYQSRLGVNEGVGGAQEKRLLSSSDSQTFYSMESQFPDSSTSSWKSEGN